MSGTPATGGGDAEPHPVVKLLAKTFEAINKDSLGQLASTRSVQGTPFQGALKAYDALDAVAEAIAEALVEKWKEKPRPTVLVQPGEDLSELAELRAVTTWIESVGDVLDKAEEEVRPIGGLDDSVLAAIAGLGPVQAFISMSAVAAVAGPLVGAALSLVGLLTRSATTEAHGAVAIGDDQLAAATAGMLEVRKFEVRRPAAMAFDPPSATGRHTPLMTRLEALANKAQALRTRLAEIEAALKAPSAKPETAAAPPDPRLLAAKFRIEAALRVFDAFWTSLPGMLPKLLRADAGQAHLAADGVILTLRVLVAGGATLTTNKALGRSEIRHEGGVLAAYGLFDATGVLASGRVARTVA